ncbi:MAG: pyruvate ferredoxin oxidoreductase [Methanomassiliicoccales archaeon]|nr:MAG: pyruvate ferredoxin oxidoreductase [Methanomassiliicoccales archaeon]
MKTVILGNMATALAAKLSRAEVIPAYPITPSTLFPEKISEYVADGEMDTQFILVESEHSAMSACIGASATGARTCTATASQGLALMHEMLYIASGMRLPIVVAVANRALSAPINIWCDHQDSISERDTGWMQFYAEKNQEALDLMIIAFKVAEDKRVLLPGMVGLDAFVLTHTMEAVDIPDQDKVDEFLPPYKAPYGVLDPEKPMTFGSFGTPEYYMEFKYAQTKALEDSEKVIDEAFAQFKETFGREYMKIKPYRTEDADIILLTLGSMSGTARAAVDVMREQGMKVGCAKMTVFRPFPTKELMDICKKTKVLAVVDRDISPGFGGAVFGEAAAIYVNEPKKPIIMNFIVGLGGRDITIPDFEAMTERAESALSAGKPERMVEWINLKEDNL